MDTQDELSRCGICSKELPARIMSACVKCGKPLCGPCDRYHESMAAYELGFSLPHICRPCYYDTVAPLKAEFEAKCKQALA